MKLRIENGVLVAGDMRAKRFISANEGKTVEVDIYREQKLSKQQLKAINVFCRLCADALNSAGFGVKHVLTHQAKRDIPWTDTTFKETIWRPIQLAMFHVESTKDLQPAEVQPVYDTILESVLSELGIYVPFPSKETDTRNN